MLNGGQIPGKCGEWAVNVRWNACDFLTEPLCLLSGLQGDSFCDSFEDCLGGRIPGVQAIRTRSYIPSGVDIAMGRSAGYLAIL